jgi:hypothetical protein
MAPPKVKNPLKFSCLPLGLAGLFLSGCFFSPLPIIEYRAATAASTWDHGIELHSGKTSNFDLKAGFLEMGEWTGVGDNARFPLYFRIACVNRSGEGVLFDPGNFRLLIPHTDSALVSIDPEAVIHQTKKDLAVEDARYAGQVGTAAILGVAGVGLDILSLFANETQAEKEEWNKTRNDMHQTNRENEESHNRTVSDLTRRVRFWSEKFLRKSSVSADARIDGQIAFGLRSTFKAPDSLLLQFKESDNRYTNLMVFGLVRDTANSR